MDQHFYDDDIYFESDKELSPEKEHKIRKKEVSVNKKAKKKQISSVSNHKNKYKHGIKKMQASEDLESIDKKEIGIESSIKSVDKKQKNREAAKNSRDRKKLYIEIMQQKQKALQKKLENKKKQLQQSKNYYERIVNQNKTMSNFTAGRHQMIKNLENIVEDKTIQDPNTPINQIIDSLRSRIGATGKERIRTINEYFRQIVNLSLPALHRYMMWSATERKHLFCENQEQQAENEEWFKELKTSLNLSEEQKVEIRNKQNILEDQKVLLQKLIDDLKVVKEDIENKSIELEDIIDGIRQILTPIQCAHFILFIEKNKYRKELNLCEEEPPKRKLVKRQI